MNKPVKVPEIQGSVEEAEFTLMAGAYAREQRALRLECVKIVTRNIPDNADIDFYAKKAEEFYQYVCHGIPAKAR